MLHVPAPARIATTPVFAFTEQTAGDVVANTTAPVPLPPAVPSVTVPLYASVNGAFVIENAAWFVSVMFAELDDTADMLPAASNA
jgi:hypothetical protein